jgi:hypothetical protein
MALPTWMITDRTPATAERGRTVLNPNGHRPPLVTLPAAPDVPTWETIPDGKRVPGALGTVNGYDVVALSEVPDFYGNGSGVFVVIAYRPWHCDRYAVWTIGEFRRDRLPLGSPLPSPRSNGRYVADWDRAQEVLTERSASLGAAFLSSPLYGRA